MPRRKLTFPTSHRLNRLVALATVATLHSAPAFPTSFAIYSEGNVTPCFQKYDFGYYYDEDGQYVTLNGDGGCLFGNTVSTGSVVIDGGNLYVYGEAGVGYGILNAASVVFGQNGGTFRVAQGGTATVGKLDLDNSNTFVSGLGARLNVTGSVVVGNAGSGSFLLESAAQATLGTLTLGKGLNAFGELSVTGVGTKLKVEEALIVGNAGRGTFYLGSGTEATLGTLTLGDGLNSSGSLSVVELGGAKLNVGGAFIVGNAGYGYFSQISGQGSNSITNIGSMTIGELSTSNGTAYISGPGSVLSGLSKLVVGNSGVGTLTIDKGASTSFFSLTIGSKPGASGTVHLRDALSQLSITGPFIIGEAGTGTLGLHNGASASFPEMTIGSKAGSSGYVQVGNYFLNDGDTVQSAQLGINGPLLVGDLGRGELAVVGGGIATVGHDGSGTLGPFSLMTLGQQAGGFGDVVVNSGSALLVNRGFVVVGDGGGGSLRIGGQVSLTGFIGFPDLAGHLTLGAQRDSSGFVSADGTGASLTVARGVVVGDAGDGFLQLGGRATASFGGLVVGRQSTSTATVSIFDVGTSLDVKGSIVVADDARSFLGSRGGFEVGSPLFQEPGASLFVGRGAVLDAIGLVIGSQPSATGVVQINGAEARLRVGLGGTVVGDAAGAVIGPRFKIGPDGYPVRDPASGDELLLPGGALWVSNGGTVSTSSLKIGNTSSAVGQVFVSNPGSRLDIDTLVVVGNAATGIGQIPGGALTLLDGAVVKALSMTVGNQERSVGFVSVTGNSSKLIVDDTLTIGELGQGTVNAFGGGAITARSILIGNQSNLQGIGQGSLTIGTGLSQSPTLVTANYVQVGGKTSFGLGRLEVNTDGGMEILDVGQSAIDSMLAGTVRVRGGELHVASLSTLTVTGPGNSIWVGGAGQANLSGIFEAVLDNPVIFPTLSSNATGLRDGRAVLAGRVRVGFTDGTPALSNGSFLPLISAQSIRYVFNGEPISRAQKTANGTSLITLGNTVFETQLRSEPDKPGSLQIYSPERLRVDCGVLSCNQVLGVRAVSPAVSGNPRPAIEKITSLSYAQQFVHSSSVAELAFLSNGIYDFAAGKTAVFPSDAYRVLSEIRLDDMYATAVQGKYGIDIVVRGTQGAPAIGTNWVANYGFSGVASTRLRQYVNNLSAFVGSVYAASEPGVPIAITGHSLGGGLAAIVGNAMGIPSFAFNAPGTGFVNDQLGAETFTIAGLGGVSDPIKQLNITLSTDPVSTLPLARLGQRITLMGDPLLYLMSQATSSVPTPSRLALNLARLKGYFPPLLDPLSLYSSHRIETVLSAIQDGNQQVVSFESGTTSYQNPDALQYAIDEASKQILAPLFAGDPNARIFASGFKAGYQYWLDPAIADGYKFQVVGDGPRFSTVLLPFLTSTGQDFDIEVLDGAQWNLLTTLHSGNAFDFNGRSVSAFRLRGILRSTSVLPIDAEPFFGVTFESSGDGVVSLTALSIDGSPLPVPEPETYMMFIAGLLLLLAMAQKRNQIGGLRR